MRLSSHAAWSLPALLAGLSTSVGASVMEINLVFPRHGEVYEPTPYMPIVFAVQNPRLTQYTYPGLGVYLSNQSSPVSEGSGAGYSQDLDRTNWFSNETFFAYILDDNFAKEGNWTISWDLCWNTCGLGKNDGAFDRTMFHNCSGQKPALTVISTRKGGRTIDLVAATANDNSCVPEPRRGYAFNVSEEVLALSWDASLPRWATARKCVMASLPDPPLALEYCRVKISPALAANICADITAHVCSDSNPPSSCSPKSAAQWPTAAAAGWCFVAAAIWGAFCFALV